MYLLSSGRVREAVQWNQVPHSRYPNLGVDRFVKGRPVGLRSPGALQIKNRSRDVRYNGSSRFLDFEIFASISLFIERMLCLAGKNLKMKS